MVANSKDSLTTSFDVKESSNSLVSTALAKMLQVPWLSSLLAFIAEITLGKIRILTALNLRLASVGGVETTSLQEQSILT